MMLGPLWSPKDWPRGGVVTQRTANPRTPVRFWAWPPISSTETAPASILPANARASPHLRLWRLLVLCGGSLITLLVAVPPDGELTPPAPHDGEIDREHEEPERDHPETEHGKEAHEPSGDKQDAEAHPDGPRLRQMPVAIE